MLLSGVPTKVPTPFASGAGGTYTRTIPIPSQIPYQNGAASYTDGFPPWCFQPGGAPFGQDFNGLLNSMSLWDQWHSAGGLALYDGTFSSAVSGYPRGAILAMNSSFNINGIWLNLADSNTNNPDTGGANWQPIWDQTFNDARYIRQAPAADYYLSCDAGNDTTGDGSADAPWLTPAHLISVVGTYSAFGQINVHLAGTSSSNFYQGFLVPPSQIGKWNFIGAGSATTIIDGRGVTASGGRGIQSYSNWIYISGITLKSDYEGIVNGTGGQVYIGYEPVSNTQVSVVVDLPTFSATASGIATYGGLIGIWGTMGFAAGGGASMTLMIAVGGTINIGYHDAFNSHAATINIGTINYGSSAGFIATNGGLINVLNGYSTFTGTPTGQRWLSSAGGTVAFNGLGVNVFPGTVAGTNNPGTTVGAPSTSNSGFYSP